MWFDVFENRWSFPGSPEGPAWPWGSGRPPPSRPPGAAGSQPCQRATALSPGVSLRMCCLDLKEEREGEKPVPRTQEAVTQEALCKAAGAVQQGQHTAEPPGPRRGGEHVSEVVRVHPPRAAGAAPPRVTGPVLPPSARQGRF